jgi:hypothetical protein
MPFSYVPPKKTEEQKLQEQLNKKKSELTGFNGPESKLNKYEIGTKDYNDAAAAAKILREQIRVLESKLAESKKAKVQDALQRAKDSGNTDEVTRRQEELDAINATINNPSDPEISGPQFVEGDEFGNAIRKAGLIVDTDENGKSFLRSSMQGYEGNGAEHFVWASKKGFVSKLPGFSGATKNTVAEVAYSYNQIEKKILEDASKQPGGKLRALEKKAIKTTTTTETSQNVAGEYIDDIDKMELMRKVAGKALEGSDIDTVLKGGAGAAQAVNGVLAYAKQYGINLNSKDALGYVANELKQGQGDLKKINAKILAISKATYGNLSDVISEDVSLAELSSNYKYNMAQVLELSPDAIDVLDPTIQTALKNNGNKGAMNLTDFDRMLRNDPRWGKTKNAREEASKYAYDVLKDFGLMA